jgi:phosphoribosylformylglycinamidine synthase subunit PurL
VVRLGDGPKGLALTTDCTERYCSADPREGGKQAVAEAWRNLIAVGARPLALTDNLNFGNPERPETMGEFVGCIEGIGEAARALDFPVVSGNVSLYNETMGAGIPPTPAIGGVGVVDDVAKAASLAFKAPGEDIWLVGGAPGWLGRSAWLMTVAGREEGAPPPVDLAAERRNGEFVAAMIRGEKVSAVHDLSDGGLALALAEMAMAGKIGASVEGEGPEHAFFFGEDQGRYVLTARPTERAAIAEGARRLNVPLLRIGLTGGDTLGLGKAAPVTLAALSKAYETWLPDFMSHPQGASS